MSSRRRPGPIPRNLSSAIGKRTELLIFAKPLPVVMGPGLRRDDSVVVVRSTAAAPHATSDSFGKLATTDWLRPPAFAA